MQRLNVLAAAAAAVLPALAQASITSTGSVNPSPVVANNGSTAVYVSYYASGTTGPALPGTLAVDGESVTSGTLYVGFAGYPDGTATPAAANASLTLTNSTWTTNGNIVNIGATTYTPGVSANVSLTNSSLTSGNVNLGNNGNGTLSLTDSTLTFNNLSMGGGTTSTASLSVNHSTLVNGFGLNFGQFGTSTTTITNGSTVTTNRNVSIGNATGAVASVTLGGGTGTSSITAATSQFSASASTRIGNSGTGTLTINGGGLLTAGVATATDGVTPVYNDVIIAAGAGSTGTLNLNGGTINLGGARLLKGTGNSATFNFNSGLVQNASEIGSSTIAFNLVQSGGTLTAGTNASAVGATTLYGTYNLASGATLQSDIAGAASLDAYTVTGAATLSGILKLNLLAGFTPTINQSFNVLTAASIDYTGLNALGWGLSLTNNPTGTQTLVATYVPEPASLAVLGLGAVATLARRRRV